MNKSLIIKLGLIAFITLILLIVLQLISGTVWERKQYQESARRAVEQSWTGQQNLFGPMLIVPYTLSWIETDWSEDGKQKIKRKRQYRGQKWFLPEEVKIDTDVVTDIRYQGIYEMPVYTSDLKIQGQFQLKSLEKLTWSDSQKENFKAEFDTPYLAIGLTDARGINSVPKLDWNGETVQFSPGSKLHFLEQGIHAELPSDLKQDQFVAFSLSVSLRGMSQIRFYPTAKNYGLTMSSPWQHPKFNGKFLPLKRNINENGFQAEWAITTFSSNMEKQLAMCGKGKCELPNSTIFGVEFIEPINVYLQSERSIKYGLLFIALVFVAFFVFEILKKLPIHPIQYSLVGLAIALFYMLLMSLSEHIHFMNAYAISALACVLLIGFYLVYILKHFVTAILFAVMLSVLYFTLYIIVSAEDFALLMGSVLVFSTLAVVMVVTRNIDWYKVGLPASVESQSHAKRERTLEL